MALPKPKKLLWQIILTVLAMALLGYQKRLPPYFRAWPAVDQALSATVEVFAWLVCGWLVISLIGILLWALWERPSGRPLPKLLQDILNTAVIFTVIIYILGSVFNAPISGLVAGSSVVAAVVGLAITRMIADVFSGMALNLEKSYGINDWLEIEMKTRPSDLITGRVMEINWRATRLQTSANEVVVIPNSEMARSKFINFSLPESHFRNEVQVPLSHVIPTERVKRILMAALRSTPEIMEEPPPFISLLRFDPRGVLWAVRFWIKDYSRNRPVMDAVHENILRHLQVAGINISYNRIEQRLIKSDASELNTKPLKEALVSRLDLFGVLEGHWLAQLADHMQERRYLPREYIVRQGQNGASLFIVAEGLVNILINDNHDQEKWVAHIEPGRYFGEMSLLTGQPRSASAQAATEVICYKITKETLEPIFQKQPELLEKISTIMAARQIELCRVQSEANAEICSFEQTKNGNWFLQQMQRFFGIKFGL